LKKVLQKFNINGDTKSKSTPFALHFKLKSTMSPTTVEEYEYMSHVLYSSAIGNLMYAMVCTRPDLSQAISTIYFYTGPSTGELVLYFTIYCCFAYFGGQVYCHDGGYEGDNLTLRVA